MYISRVRLRTEQQRLRHLYTEDAYSEHRLLMSLFPAQVAKDFRLLYRRDDRTQPAQYYLVSPLMPDAAHPVLNVESKAYQPELQAGRRLQFDLRANPTVKRRDENGRLCRHDVVMHYKSQPEYRALPEQARPGQNVIAQREGARWLQSRAEQYGFQLLDDCLSINAYITHRIYQPKQQRHIYYSSVDFSGVLTVTDSSAFSRLLFQGVGTAKAFGCGLLLVRRA